MNKETSQRALEKVKAIKPYIGYHDAIFNDSMMAEMFKGYEPPPRGNVSFSELKDLFQYLSSVIHLYLFIHTLFRLP